MNENRISFEVKTQVKTQSQRSHDIVNIAHYTYNPWDSIGLGYVSNVYLGKDNNNNSNVAIKVVDTNNKDQLVHQFLESEVIMLEKIKLYGCRHLLKLLDTFTVDSKKYIVTEYCEGKDLAKVLRQLKRFNEKEAQTIMKQIVKTYEELYQLGIVHRDLKLSNLLVRQGEIILADFGFALPIIDCIGQFPYNAGSPYYMPPQSLKRNRFSFKSDIWALGVMAYELIFGTLPFRQKVESMLYETIMESSIEQKLEGTSLSENYKQFIICCMDKDMQTRATPQFVINYNWPLAEPSLPDCFSHALNELQTPHLPKKSSSQQFSQSQLEGNNQSVQPLFAKNSTNYMLSSNQNKTERIRIVQFQPHRTNIQNELRQRHPMTQPPLRNPPMFRPQFRSQTDVFTPFFATGKKSSSDKQINGDVFKHIEKIAKSMVSYCNFLFNLYKLLEEDTSLPEGHLLRMELAGKILENYQEIKIYMEGQTSMFGTMPSFKQFSTTQQYHSLKDDIGVYSYFFSSKFNFSRENSKIEPDTLVKAIRKLANKMPSHYALAKQLCHYYELKRMEEQGIQFFAFHSNAEELTASKPEEASPSQLQCQQLQNWAIQLTH